MKIVQRKYFGRKKQNSIRKNVRQKQQEKNSVRKKLYKNSRTDRKNRNLCIVSMQELKRKQSRLRQKRPNCPEYAGTCKQHDDACKENTAHDGENAGLKVHIEDTCGKSWSMRRFPGAGCRRRAAERAEVRCDFAPVFPALSPFSRHQVKNFPYTSSLGRQEPFRRTGK